MSGLLNEPTVSVNRSGTIAVAQTLKDHSTLMIFSILSSDNHAEVKLLAIASMLPQH